MPLKGMVEAWYDEKLYEWGSGIEEQKSLAYFTDDKGKYRVYICE
jgi:hypothetical protein